MYTQIFKINNYLLSYRKLKNLSALDMVIFSIKHLTVRGKVNTCKRM